MGIETNVGSLGMPERSGFGLRFRLLPFCGRVHFLVHSWSNNCYLAFQSAVLVAIRAA